MRIGNLWGIFTQLPVAFSGGKREKEDPLAGDMASIVPW